MKKVLLFAPVVLLASCGSQPAPHLPITAQTEEAETSKLYYYDPNTGSITEADNAISAQAFNSGCTFAIANPHMSKEIPGHVKVNGVGQCKPNKYSQTVIATMILEKCHDAFGVQCYPYATGTPSAKPIGPTLGATWANKNLNAHAYCGTSSYYRGRLALRAVNPTGGTMVLPITAPDGPVVAVKCPGNP